MTADEFKDWMRRLSFTYAAASRNLGVSERTAYNYASGFEIPLYIALACRQLETDFNAIPSIRDAMWDELGKHTMKNPPSG